MASSARLIRTLNAAVHASATHGRGSVAQRMSRFHASARSQFSRIEYTELKPFTQHPTLDRIIIDVREVNEVQQGSIPSAVNLPLSALPRAMEAHPDAFRNEYGFERPGKRQEVIVYCRSGKRSTSAAEHLENLGYKNIKNYTGSWLDWTQKEQGAKDA